MKRNTLSLLELLAVAIAAGELQTNLTTPVQPSTSRPIQTGYVLERIPFSAVHHQQAGIPRIHLWDSTTGNWSGYAVPQTGSGVDTFTDVQGTWQVPTVTGNKRSATYSSIWVGLDGYANGTVEQIGTEQDWTPHGQQNYAWFEMYPAGAYLIKRFPVNPGDWITAQVQYDQVKGAFVLSIHNTTQQASFTVSTTSTSATRQSAEWIVEAPWSGKVLPLANFGTVSFFNCQATSSSVNAGPINSWTADALTMIDWSGSVAGAAPSGLSADINGGSDFSVRWFVP